MVLEGGGCSGVPEQWWYSLKLPSLPSTETFSPGETRTLACGKCLFVTVQCSVKPALMSERGHTCYDSLLYIVWGGPPTPTSPLQGACHNLSNYYEVRVQIDQVCEEHYVWGTFCMWNIRVWIHMFVVCSAPSVWFLSQYGVRYVFVGYPLYLTLYHDHVFAIRGSTLLSCSVILCYWLFRAVFRVLVLPKIKKRVYFTLFESLSLTYSDTC